MIPHHKEKRAREYNVRLLL
jgi:hypothetical protein